MLRKLWDRSLSPIGLDMGGRHIRLLQLRGRTGGAQSYAVVAAACRAVPADLPAAGPERVAALAEILNDALAEGHFVGHQVVSCLPASAVQYRNLRFPRMPADELRQAVAWEACGHQVPIESAPPVQFFDVGEVRQGEDLRREVILLTAPPEQIDHHLQVLRTCNLSPLAIDAVPAALARVASLLDQEQTDPPARAILDVGHQHSKVLIARQGSVLFFKSIDLGGASFDQAVATRLNLPLHEAAELRRTLRQTAATETNSNQLFGSSRRETVERAISESVRSVAGDLGREVGLCLRYYSVTFRGRRPESILLAGGGADEPQLIKALTEDANVAARPLASVLNFSRTNTALIPDDEQGRWAVALGLASRLTSQATRRKAA